MFALENFFIHVNSEYLSCCATEEVKKNNIKINFSQSRTLRASAKMLTTKRYQITLPGIRYKKVIYMMKPIILIFLIMDLSCILLESKKIRV